MPPRINRPIVGDLPPGTRRQGVFVEPRQAGESEYSYRTRRSLALYGQTPYQRRIYLAQARGITGGAARGHRNEAQRRRESFRNRIGIDITESSYRSAYAINWLITHGYTPEATGLSWTQLLRLEPRLRWMYETRGPGSRVTPAMIAEAVELERTGQLERGWAFERIWRKYEDMYAYQEYRDRGPGRESWAEVQAVHDFIPEVAIQFWYYR